MSLWGLKTGFAVTSFLSLICGLHLFVIFYLWVVMFKLKVGDLAAGDHAVITGMRDQPN